MKRWSKLPELYSNPRMGLQTHPSAIILPETAMLFKSAEQHEI